MKYTTSGTCSRSISYDIDAEGKLRNVQFEAGCGGNTQGLSAMVEGMPAREVIARLKGIQCRNNTSCPDQLARALEAQLEAEAK